MYRILYIIVLLQLKSLKSDIMEKKFFAILFDRIKLFCVDIVDVKWLIFCVLAC